MSIEQIELQAKLLNYFLGSNKSNINQLYFLAPHFFLGLSYSYVCANTDIDVVFRGMGMFWACKSGALRPSSSALSFLPWVCCQNTRPEEFCVHLRKQVFLSSILPTPACTSNLIYIRTYWQIYVRTCQCMSHISDIPASMYAYFHVLTCYVYVYLRI